MAKSRFRWSKPPTQAWSAAPYVIALERGVMDVLQYYAPQVTADAKTGAPWRDRTGNARQSLLAFEHWAQQHVAALTLMQVMEYGVFLELRHQGRYAIVLPTLEPYYERVWGTIKDLMSR